MNLSEDSVLRRYPYMLPSLVSGVLSMVSWLVALLLLKESNKEVLIRKGLHPPAPELELDELTSRESDELEEDLDDNSFKGAELGISSSSSDPTSPSKLAPLIGERAREEGGDAIQYSINNDAQKQNQGLWGTLRSAVQTITGTKSKKYSHIVESDEDETDSASTHVSVPVSEKSSSLSRKPGGAVIRMIFGDRSVMVAILLLALASLCVVTIDELFPLWAMNPPPVGLGTIPTTT